MTVLTRLTKKQTFMVRTAARQVFREGVAKRGATNTYKKPMNLRPDWFQLFQPQDFNVVDKKNPMLPHEMDQSLSYFYVKKFDRMLIDATQYISDYQTPKR